MQSSVSNTVLGKTDGDAICLSCGCTSPDAVGCFELCDGDARWREMTRRSSSTCTMRSEPGMYVTRHVSYVEGIPPTKETLR